jgi:hypothetical protein
MSHAGSDGAPPWLLALVAEGLQRLLVLRLEGAPSADTIEGVSLAWADALLQRNPRWQAQRDAERIRQAFRALAARAQRWPAPAQWFEHLEPLPPLPLLAPPAPSPEQRARVRELLQQARNRFVR